MLQTATKLRRFVSMIVVLIGLLSQPADSADGLRATSQPVGVAPFAQVGENDFRISHMGPDAISNIDVEGEAIAYNSQQDEYLVVWWADDTTDGEIEIYGQRVNAETGGLLGNRFRISDMGPPGDTLYPATEVSVAYNSAANEYLVVWHGDDDVGTLVNNEFEIFGQRLSGTGAELGADDFRISDMGTNGDTQYIARFPQVTYSTFNNQYLVVWRGDDDSGTLVNEEYEVFGQRLNAAGTEVPPNDFRISDMGTDGDPLYQVSGTPRVVYNAIVDEYLVVWQGDDNTGTLVNDEMEVFGQRIRAQDGVPVGTNDFRISDMGTDGNQFFGVTHLGLAYNSIKNEYLVVWSGDNNLPGMANEEYEIWGQLLDATGAAIGVNDFRISDAGADGNANFQALRTAVTFNSATNEYLVVWYADDNATTLVNDEYEIFSQRISAFGEELGDNDFRLSDMGPDGNTAYNVINMGVAYSIANNSYLIVWHGDDNVNGLVDGELEVFGQLFAVPITVYLPVVLREHFTCLQNLSEVEPNNRFEQANRYLCSGLNYTGKLNDTRDYFSIYLTSPGTITVGLTQVALAETQLHLYDSSGNLACPTCRATSAPYQITYNGAPPGEYYIRIATAGGTNTTQPYTLRVTYP